MNGTSNDKDLAVQAIQIQVLSRDLERLQQDVDDNQRKNEKALEDYQKENNKAVRGLQDAQRWVLGAMAVVGSILTVSGSALLKYFAGVIARG